MNLDDLNLHERNKNTATKDSLIKNLMKELQHTIKNFIKNSSTISNDISDNSIYVVRDTNDEKLSLVNINEGSDIDIYVTYSEEKIEKLKAMGVSNNIYLMSKEDFYNLNLGSNITIKNGICTPYYGEVKIKNSKAAAKLEDLFFCLEQEKEAIYSVADISDCKIYLTNTKEGGYFSIPQEAYPNLKVGDLVKNIDGKYVLI